MSYEIAFDLLEHAEQGNPIDQFNVGLMYESGDLVTLDPGAAMYWYQKAAEQGLPEAQFNLGNMYVEEEGGHHRTPCRHICGSPLRLTRTMKMRVIAGTKWPVV